MPIDAVSQPVATIVQLALDDLLGLYSRYINSFIATYSASLSTDEFFKVIPVNELSEPSPSLKRPDTAIAVTPTNCYSLTRTVLVDGKRTDALEIVLHLNFSKDNAALKIVPIEVRLFRSAARVAGDRVNLRLGIEVKSVSLNAFSDYESDPSYSSYHTSGVQELDLGPIPFITQDSKSAPIEYPSTGWLIGPTVPEYWGDACIADPTFCSFGAVSLTVKIEEIGLRADDIQYLNEIGQTTRQLSGDAFK